MRDLVGGNVRRDLPWFYRAAQPRYFAYLGNNIQSYDTYHHRSVALSKTIQQTYYS